MKPIDFIHPEDYDALHKMESIPGFAGIVKKILALGYENLQYGINMASAIRLSEKQLPDLYRHLPPICQQFDIPEPEFYLQMNPIPNAFTFGDTRIYVTVTSGLVEMMNGKEMDAVLAHECGHIVCRHVLYHTVARWLTNGIASLGWLGNLAAPVEYAMLYWYRKSELSADRAASVYTSPEDVAMVMARLAGGPANLTAQIDFDEWAHQADQYEEIRNANMWNKALQIAAVSGIDHPYSAVRVREILKWGKSEQYQTLKHALLHRSEKGKCQHCGAATELEWKFCHRCGGKL